MIRDLYKLMNRLKEKFEKEAKPVLAKEFSINNSMAIPRIKKIVINMGVGEAAKNQALMDGLRRDIAAISGQFPSVRNAKVSIASFSLRAGMPVGLSVTLRGNRMYSFLDRLMSVTLPRLRDFRGTSLKSFDKSGNYTLGFVEHTVFPEIDPAKSAAPHGLEVTIVITGGNVIQSKKLLELLGVPFQK
ncbi:MAG: 50S ribosomal protein L5, large subunit ribosomal protein L5 [Microgenomates group bacterium GW2011_GWC1_39_7b]|nr:MAG: 50S ribosomal protein L5, large subunit ribosomal protein L5 [Microgenomates group bacterium GW2011_GWC1_39_7b]